MRLLFFLLTVGLTAISQKQPSVSNHFLSRADSCSKALKYDSAVFYYKKALPELKKHLEIEKQAFVHNKIAENYLLLSDLSAAKQHAQKALSLTKLKPAQLTVEEAAAYETLGSIKVSEGDYQQGIDLFNNALMIVGKLHQRTAQLYRKSGNAYNLMGDYNKALEYFRKSLLVAQQVLGEKHQEIAWAYNNIAGYYYMEGDFFTALEYLKKALLMRIEIFGETHPEVSASYTNMGTLYKEIGDYTKSIEYHQKALAIRKSLNSKFHEEGVSFNNLGIVYHEKGDYELAMEYYLKALAIQIGKSGEKHPLIAGFYYNIGLLHADRGEFDKALEYYEKALKIQMGITGENHPDISDYYNAIGIVHLYKKEYDKALIFQSKALEIQKKLFGESHMKVAASYTNLGDIELKKGNFLQAIQYQKKSLKIKKEIYGEKNPTVATAFYNLGESFRLQGNFNEALKYFQKSLIANSMAFNDVEISHNPTLRDQMDQNVFLKSLEKKATVLLQISLVSNSLKDLRTSIKTYTLADVLVDELRQSHLNHSDKVELGKVSKVVYEGAIRACLEMQKKSGNKDFVEEAFYFSEKSKAGALKEAIFEADAKQFAGIPSSLLSVELDLKLKKSFYQSAIQEERENPTLGKKLKEYEELLFKTNRFFDSLILSFRKNYPSYYQLTNQKISKVGEIKKALGEESVIVEYFTGDTTIYIFTITSDEIHYFEVKIDGQLKKWVEELRLSLDPGKVHAEPATVYSKFTSNAHSIYQNYLKKALTDAEDRQKLIIIPDGELGYIPFDILLTKPVAGGKIDYTSLPYLLHQFQTRYAYSAALLLEEKSEKKKADPKYIAFAPTYSGANEGIFRTASLGKFRDRVTALSWNQPEVTNISRYLDGITLKGNQAGEKKFKSLANRYDIIHLAMHALIDDEKPMYSRLVFSQEKDSSEDGFLNAYEIYNMSLPADMVVLSACATGYGKLEKGEGVMSLARAFSYAGCPSVVMSHWLVDDEATAKLMELFYKNLNEGMEKDEALQTAKKEFLKTANVLNQPPGFWAGFVLLGDPSPIKSSPIFENYSSYLLSAFILLSLVALIIHKKRRLRIIN